MVRDPRPVPPGPAVPPAALPADPAAISAAQLTALTDPSRCPSCGSPLAAVTCSTCGVDLTSAGAELWRLSQEARAALERRARLLGGLRRAAADRAAAVAAAPAAKAPLPLPTAPAAVPPPRTGHGEGAAGGTPGTAGATGGGGSGGGRGIHEILVGLGALLLSVAAVGFLVFSWRVLPLAGRAAVIAVCTVAVLALAARLRSRLSETAEAVGALGVVLVLADAWAVRRTGLLGADRPETLAYAAGAAAVAGALLGGWAVLGRVRAGSIAASALLPLSLVLAGAQGSVTSGSGREWTAGLVAAAALAAARRPLPVAWRAERVLLRTVAAAGLGTAAVVAVPALATPPGEAAALLAAAAGVTLLQAFADRPGAAETRAMLLLRRGWSVAAGGIAASVAVPMGRALREPLGMDPVDLVPAVPLLAGVAVVALSSVRTRPGAGPRQAALTGGAAAAALATALPALILAGWQVFQAAALGLVPWSVDPDARLGSAAGEALSTPQWRAGVLGLVVTCVWCLLAGRVAGRARTDRGGAPPWLSRALRLSAAGTAGVLAVALPLAPGLRVRAVVAALVLVAAASLAATLVVVPAGATDREAAAARGTTRVPDALRAVALAVATVVGTLAVVVSWSTRSLCVPVTLTGIGALLLARRGVAARSRWPLAGIAAGAAAVVAGACAGLAGAGVDDRFVIAGSVGVLLAAAALVLPGQEAARAGAAPWAVADRLAAAAAGALALLAALPRVAALYAEVPLTAATNPFGTGDGAPWQPQVLLAALLVALLATSVRPHAAVLAAAPVLPVVATSAVPPVAALATLAAGADVVPAAAAAVLLAIVTAVCAAGVAVLALLERFPAPDTSGPSLLDRRLAAEGGVLLTGVAALAATAGASQLWVVLLLLGAGAAAIAAVPDRRPVGWVAGVLLTASTWVRLALAEVATVEAYTLPPAVALLVVGALRLHRDRAADPRRILAPGAALAVVPSILASGDERVRAAILVAAGAVLVLASAAGARRWGGRLEPVLVGTALVTAVGAAGARLIARVAGGTAGGVPVQDVEAWAAAAAGVVVLAALTVRGHGHGQGRGREGRRSRNRVRNLLLALALAVGALPSLVAALAPVLEDVTPGPGGGWRAAGVLAASSVAVLAASLLRPRREPVARVGVALAGAATVTGLVVSAGPAPEVWTLPLAGLLIVLGADRMDREAVGSWAAVGPGVALLLLPSLLLSADERSVPRAVAVVVLGLVTVWVGGARRLQAPLVLGATVLAVHAVVHLAPWVARAYSAVPLWGTLATAGVLLLVLGATYERRLQQARAVRARVSALR